MRSPLIIAEDLQAPEDARPRIVVDLEAKTIRFESCHHTRGFLSHGVEPVRVCRFDEIVAVTDFLLGDEPGRVVNVALAAGPLVSCHSTSSDLASMWISTRTGRCRVFNSWTGFAELREILRELAPEGGRPPWSEDVRLLPLFVLAMLGLVAGLVYLLM